MEKYLVIVNQKYLVNVEANSHGGAEHRVLDLVYGITGAQAFSKKDMSTEFFRDYAINCETVSFNWLVEQSKYFQEVGDMWPYINKYHIEYFKYNFTFTYGYALTYETKTTSK